MTRSRLLLAGLCSWLCAGASSSAASETPLTISPGDAAHRTLVEARCPTFSWGEVGGALGYELALYRLGDEDAKAEPLLRRSFAGAVTLWTPPLEACLERGGRYAWSVRAIVGSAASRWSAPSLFAVAPGPSAARIEEEWHRLRESRTSLGASRPWRLLPPVTGAVPVSAAGALEVREEGGRREEAKAADLRVASQVVHLDGAVLPVREQDCRAGRFEDSGDGTVTDCRSGLVWLKDASCFGVRSWADAKAAAAGLYDGSVNDPEGGDCGLADGSRPGFWRLSTATELMALIASARKQGLSSPVLTDRRGTAQWTEGEAFASVVSSEYWSSSTVSFDAAAAHYVGLDVGDVGGEFKTGTKYFWPVRAGR